MRIRITVARNGREQSPQYTGPHESHPGLSPCPAAMMSHVKPSASAHPAYRCLLPSPMSASTYYPPQTYGNYSQQYPAYAGQPSQYPAQYPSPAAGQTQTPTFPYAPSPVKTSGSPQPESHNAPDLAEVNEAVASRTMQRFVSSELRHAGFDAAAPTALRRLELETVSCPYSTFFSIHATEQVQL